jgi:hypothetical protein
MIQRWTIDAREYVTYADHVAREAELIRLLKWYRKEHRDCVDYTIDYPDEADCRCSKCKVVDALEVSK